MSNPDILIGFSCNSYSSQRLGSDSPLVSLISSTDFRNDCMWSGRWGTISHQEFTGFFSELWKVSAHTITHIMVVLRQASPLSVYLSPFCLFCPTLSLNFPAGTILDDSQQVKDLVFKRKKLKVLRETGSNHHCGVTQYTQFQVSSS